MKTKENIISNRRPRRSKKSRIDMGMKVNEMADRVAREKQQIRGPHKRPGTIKEVPRDFFNRYIKSIKTCFQRNVCGTLRI